MRIDFREREVVITGSTGALGGAVARILAEAGARCFLPTRSEIQQERFPHLNHPNIQSQSGIDLTHQDSTDSYYRQFSNLWASIHCAGGFTMAPIEKISWGALEAQMNINFKTCFLCCRAAVRQMRLKENREGGRIVNVISRPALESRTGAGMVSYTSSKAAVAALTEALGEELATERIWVTAVAPSILDTVPNRKAMPDADFSRWPKVEEVARTVAFLASPENQVVRSGLVPTYGQS